MSFFVGAAAMLALESLIALVAFFGLIALGIRREDRKKREAKERLSELPGKVRSIIRDGKHDA